MKMALLEAVVINPAEVDKYVKRLGNMVEFQDGKAWLAKRLRFVILNSDVRYLRLSLGREVTANSPDYVKAAVERGEPVYSFDDLNVASLSELANEANIVSDYLNGVWQAAHNDANPNNPVAVEEQKLAKKTLEKLPKVTWTQALDAAEKWAKSAAKKARKLSKTGGDIVAQWQNGYYAISFTEKSTMMRDGAQLQNCLARGYYWDNVSRGEQIVIAIRKPNDEAVVGLRFSKNGRQNFECKGKNNKTIEQRYVPYVVDLLRILGTRNVSHDLAAAGIELNAEGTFGTFKDVADVIYDKAPLKIWQSLTRGVVEKNGQHAAVYTVSNGHISSFEPEEDETDLVNILQAIGLPPTEYLLSNLAQEGIYLYFNEGKWGTLKDVGEYMGRVQQSKIFKVRKAGTHGGSVYLSEDDGLTAHIKLDYDSGFIEELPYQIFQVYPERDIANILDMAGIRLKTKGEMVLWEYGYAYSSTDKKYIKYTNGKPVQINKNISVFQIPGRPLYINNKAGISYFFADSRKRLYTNANLNKSSNAVIYYLINKNIIKSTVQPDDLSTAGVAEMDGVLYADGDEMVEVFAKLPVEKRVYSPVGLAEDTAQCILNGSEGGILDDNNIMKLAKLMTPSSKEYFVIEEFNTLNLHGAAIHEASLKIADGLVSVFYEIETAYYAEPINQKILDYVQRVREKIETAVMIEIKKRDNEGRITIYHDRSNWPYDDFGKFLKHHNETTIKRVKDKAHEVLNNNAASINDKFAALRAQQKMKKAEKR